MDPRNAVENDATIKDQTPHLLLRLAASTVDRTHDVRCVAGWTRRSWRKGCADIGHFGNALRCFSHRRCCIPSAFAGRWSRRWEFPPRTHFLGITSCHLVAMCSDGTPEEPLPDVTIWQTIRSGCISSQGGSKSLRSVPSYTSIGEGQRENISPPLV